MVVRKLYQDRWERYFHWVTEQALTLQVRIDLADADGGNAWQGQQLLGIAYDPDADLLSVRTTDHKHRLPRPRRVYLFEVADSLTSLEVVCDDGARSRIHLDRPLGLPPVD